MSRIRILPEITANKIAAGKKKLRGRSFSFDMYIGLVLAVCAAGMNVVAFRGRGFSPGVTVGKTRGFSP